MTAIEGWHFLPDNGRTQFSDEEVRIGEWLESEGDPALCRNGMHASKRLIDALAYAPGALLCRVELEGDITHGNDKLVGRRRRVLWMVDATMILHEFACRCAEDALALIPDPDPRSIAAIEAKRRWMTGAATDAELKAAWEAARTPVDTAWCAAARAAWHAAARAAEGAAEGAARAARAAVDTAWHAAWAAADTASAATRPAARDAAWSAAGAAASDAQNRRLTSMVVAERKRQESKEES